LTGPDGLPKALTKAVIETVLDEEMGEHLGYDRHAVEGRNGGDSRNGTRAKTVLTEAVGEVRVEVPRDREGTFEPVIVKKRQRRLTEVDKVVLSLYAKGLTTGELLPSPPSMLAGGRWPVAGGRWRVAGGRPGRPPRSGSRFGTGRGARRGGRATRWSRRASGSGWRQRMDCPSCCRAGGWCLGLGSMASSTTPAAGGRTRVRTPVWSARTVGVVSRLRGVPVRQRGARRREACARDARRVLHPAVV
jgi:hypothetical protein